jgi:hypothetical protein
MLLPLLLYFGKVDLGSDTKDWVKLNSGEQHFIKMVLAFFAARYFRIQGRDTRACTFLDSPNLSVARVYAATALCWRIWPSGS